MRRNRHRSVRAWNHDPLHVVRRAITVRRASSVQETAIGYSSGCAGGNGGAKRPVTVAFFAKGHGLHWGTADSAGGAPAHELDGLQRRRKLPLANDDYL